MTTHVRILSLENDLKDRGLAAEALAADRLECEFRYVTTREAFEEALERGNFDLILADFTLPAYDGATALRAAQRLRPDVPFVMVSGTIGEEQAVESLKAGATDYVLKDRLARLAPAVRRALSERELRRGQQEAQARLRASEARYRLVFNGGYDAILVHEGPDSQGGLGKFLEVNDVACRRLGYTREELLRMSPFELDAPEHAEAIRAVVEKLASEKHAIWETVIVAKDGQRIPVEISSTLFDLNGKPAYLSTIRDITERKRGEGRLRLLSAALEATANAVVITDREGVICWANPAFSQLTGYSRLEVLGRKTSLLRSGAHDLAFYRQLWDTVRSGRVWQSEMVNRRKDGTLYTEENTITPVRDEQGEIAYFIAVKRDITERKQAEEALRCSQAELAAAQRLAKYGNWSWDIVGDRVSWSEELYRIFDIEKAELRHTHDSFLERVEPADRDAVVQASRQAQLEGLPFEIEYAIRTSHGERRVIRELGQAARDGAGEVVRLFGTAQDITAQKAAEAELRWKTAFLEAQVNSSLDGILVVNSEGKQILRNERMLQLWKIRPEIAAERDDRKVLQAVMEQVKDPLQFAEGVKYLYSHPDEVSRDEVELTDGTILERYSSPVTGKDGTIYGRTWTFRDVTERRQLEAELRQAQKMEAVGQLAGGVAHDFNNMLAVIRGNAELLALDAECLSAEAKECLQHIITASDSAASLTRQLLIFSRKQIMQAQPLVLNDLVRNLTKMLKRVIREDIRLECSYAEGLPAVQADPSMMEQVLLNLVVNSRDAMPQGGVIAIATERVRLDESSIRTGSAARAGEFVSLRVSDTGTGIKPELLERIFEPFFTTKEPGKGTGLGLATVHGIVKQHQGWVEVASDPGTGTTFTVFLPALSSSAASTTAQKPEPKLRRGTETILLVEDEASVRSVFRQALEACGYKVCEASCAREALEIWGRQAAEIALLLSDIVMPEGTGRDLAEQLRTQRPGLRVVFMSGYSVDVIGKDTEFFRRTKSHFLHKPCTARDLIQTIRRCLDEQ